MKKSKKRHGSRHYREAFIHIQEKHAEACAVVHPTMSEANWAQHPGCGAEKKSKK
jgi:hypothetical protein